MTALLVLTGQVADRAAIARCRTRDTAGRARQTACGPTSGSVIVSNRAGTGASARNVSVIVENSGGMPVSLRAGVSLQRNDNGAFHDVQAAGLLLRTECGGVPLPSCVTIAARTTVVTAPWLGTVGDAQCACERCTAAPAGTYRFVVFTCDGRPIAGTPFTFAGQ